RRQPAPPRRADQQPRHPGPRGPRRGPARVSRHHVLYLPRPLLSPQARHEDRGAWRQETDQLPRRLRLLPRPPPPRRGPEERQTPSAPPHPARPEQGREHPGEPPRRRRRRDRRDRAPPRPPRKRARNLQALLRRQALARGRNRTPPAKRRPRRPVHGLGRAARRGGRSGIV
ncbi:MAG: COG0488: ATPase components of ABC transporters with duplicated ATPase domains, partial [uncultured Rubrobacteraceae bacterium]